MPHLRKQRTGMHQRSPRPHPRHHQEIPPRRRNFTHRTASKMRGHPSRPHSSRQTTYPSVFSLFLRVLCGSLLLCPLLPSLVRTPQPFHQHLPQRPAPQLGGKPHPRTQRPPQRAAVDRPHRPRRHRLEPQRNQPHHLIQVGRLHLVARHRPNRRAQLRSAQRNHRQPHPLGRRARLRGIRHRLAVRPLWRRPPRLGHYPRAHLRIHARQRLFHHHVLCRKHKVVQQKFLAVPPSQLVVMRSEPAFEEPAKRRQRRALQRLRN